MGTTSLNFYGMCRVCLSLIYFKYEWNSIFLFERSHIYFMMAVLYIDIGLFSSNV